MIVATDDAVTDVVEIVKVALVAPAATITLAGTAAAALLLESATPNPPAGAAAVNVTFPCAETPPVTLVGLTDSAESDAAAGGGVTVSVVVFVAPPYAPVIVTGVEVPTALVVIVNVALVAPAATVTLGGTAATAALPLESVTAPPPVGAAVVSVAVPCAGLPPTTLVGLSEIAERAAGVGGGVADAFTVSDLDALRRSSPEIVTAVSAVTDAVEIGKVALATPAGTVTLAGTLAAAFELNSCTTAPPLGAAL